MWVRGLSQRGDTIVEVLIAIAVAGAVIGGAYSLVNATTKNNLAAQERSAATKVAESQVEMLRAYVGTGKSLPLTGNFCMYETSGVVAVATFTEALPSVNNSGYPPDCLVDYGNATDRYVAGIARGDDSAFIVYVNWDSPNNTRAQVSLAYKVYP